MIEHTRCKTLLRIVTLLRGRHTIATASGTLRMARTLNARRSQAHHDPLCPGGAGAWRSARRRRRRNCGHVARFLPEQIDGRSEHQPRTESTPSTSSEQENGIVSWAI